MPSLSTLYLVRHGQAEQRNNDFDRQLTDRGRHDVTRVAAFIQPLVRVDRIEHSDLVRARETAEILGRALKIEPNEVTGLRPESDVEAARTRVLASNGPSLLLVGHNPSMERLASLLIADNPDLPAFRMPTASVICLRRSESGIGWRFTCEWLLTPDMLPGW